MRTRIRNDSVVIVPDEGSEQEQVTPQLDPWVGHAFRVFPTGGAFVFRQLGPHDDVFLVPINITSVNADRRGPH